MSQIITCRDIFKDYARGKLTVPVLKHVTFTVQQGEYIAIMGPSGSGKTTLMNIIGCLDVPTSGTFLLDGEEISGLSENRMAEIRNKTLGFVFQHADLLPELTALDNVALPLLYRGVRKKSAAHGQPRCWKKLDWVTAWSLSESAVRRSVPACSDCPRDCRQSEAFAGGRTDRRIGQPVRQKYYAAVPPAQPRGHYHHHHYPCGRSRARSGQMLSYL